MNRLLKEHGFSIQYERSTRWDEWPDTRYTSPLADFVKIVLREGVVAYTHPKCVGNHNDVGKKAGSSEPR